MTPRPGPRALLPYAFVSRFLQWGILGIVLPISNLLRQAKGLSLAELGFSAAVLSGTVALLELPTGILADRIGRKRTFLLSLLFSAASCLVLLFVDGFILVTVGFALYGVARALASGSVEALFIDRFVELRGKGSLHRLMSIMSAGEISGLAAGSLAGGAIPVLWSALAPGANRYHGNLFSMLVVVIVLAILTVFGITEPAITVERRPRLRAFLADSVVFVRSNRVVGLLFLAAAVWGFAFSAIETYWQPQVAGLLGSDGTTWVFGLLSAGYFLSALLGSLAATPVLERTKVSPLTLLAVLRLVTAVFIALLAFQGGVPGFAVIYVAMFFWNGMTNPPEGTALNREIPSERRASMLSVASLSVQVGGLAGAAAFGFLVEKTSILVVWLVAAGVLAASSVLYPLAARRLRGGGA